MSNPTSKPKVIIRHCDSYDAERIRTIVREGLEELDLRPSGRTLVKPNLVAAGPLFQHAHTNPIFAEGLLRGLQDRDGGMTELAVGERCGITMPTRFTFELSGFDEMLKRVPNVKRYCFEEEQQVEIPLTHPQRLRDYLFTPEAVARADFFVNAPKFKAHPWTTVTFSIKGYIGIQDDRHRLIDHDHRLNEKIADLQHIIQPQFICIDAIIAGEGRMLTPIPFPLNLIVMGNNQVAFDSVCSRLIGVDPATVDHIRLAHEHGFGPMAQSEIDVSGDVTFEAACERGKKFKVGLVRVEKYFEGTAITAYAGPPPESEATDYCWGGCPGAIEEAIEILRKFDDQCDAKMPRLHVVFGDYKGPIDAKAGEKVVFMGDCSAWKGNLGKEFVQIRSTYKDRTTKDPHRAKHDDIFAKMIGVTTKLAIHSGDSYVRFEGCPVSVAEQALALVGLSGVKNPYFEPHQTLHFNKGYLQWKGAVAMKRLRGQRYQKHGSFEGRGKAMPDTELPKKRAATSGDAE
jgi:uncharacterized protein (DUF362 family)